MIRLFQPILFVFIILTLTNVTVTAVSDPLQQDDLKSRAQEHFARGEALFDAGRYDEAAAAFLLAYQTLPHYVVLANIGVAYERSGAFPEAAAYFQKYLSALAQAGEQNPLIASLLEETLAKVAQIEITAECIHDPCRIFVDNIDQGESPVRLTVWPGNHDLRVGSEGETRIAKKLHLDGGETKEISLSEIAAPIVLKAPEDKTVPLGIPFWVAATSAVVSGTTAGVLFAKTLQTKDDFDRTDDIRTKNNLKRTGENLQIGAWVAVGVAAAAAVSAAILAGLHVSSSKSEGKQTISAVASPQTIGLRIEF